jgi:hypothetical protein
MFQKLFPVNERRLDRALRIAFGVVLLALTLPPNGFASGYVGIVPLLTGLVGSCPVYTLFGISTCPYSPPRKTTQAC